MGRAERRRQDKQDRLEAKAAFIAYEKAREAETKKLVLDAVHDAEEYTKHHITGEMYTALAVKLRKAPYRWPAEKVMRLMESVGGVINDLSEGRMSDAELVAEGEKAGIRVVWSADHKFIEAMSIFEEGTEHV